MKITRTTLKNFLKREGKAGRLYIKKKSDFDGTVDCVMPVESEWTLQNNTYDETNVNTLGFGGVWLVGHSRDYITEYQDNNYIGYEVTNCCGSFLVGFRRI